MAKFTKLDPRLACSLSSYVLLDFETTGLSNKDRIVEVGCAKVLYGKITETFQTLVNPEMAIPYYASQIHGIYTKDVIDSPTVAEMLPLLLDFIGDSVLVAYNADFDMRFLQNAIKSCFDCDTEIRYLDALACAKLALPGSAGYKLQSVREQLGIESNNAHRSLDDVIITHKVFEICRERMIG